MPAASHLAVRLQEQGVSPGDLVGIFLDRSPDMVIALLAVWMAGGAYVPLDPAFPSERLGMMIEDSTMRLIVTSAGLVASLPPNNAAIACLDKLTSDLSSPISLPASSGPNDLAYVIFTSGSTGRPKGVEITHQALANCLHSMRQEPGLSTRDILLAVTTLSFDIAGLELLLPLTTGAKVVVVPREVAVDGSQLVELLEDAEVTIMQATPATWRLLLAAGWKGSSHLKILCGGEPLPPELARELLPRCAELWNMYGPTETTIWSTCTRIRSEKEIHIGRPIDNTEIYILDRHFQPVPIGVTGELLIGGDGLARGYLNRPELTAEKFIPHPFKTGARLYRTGDLAKYRPDGNIVCLGRMDFQVKIRGYRIELGEIEAVLSRHPEVAHAVVSVYDAGQGGQQLAAYIVQRKGVIPSSDVLRQHLRQELPDYMVPTVFVPLEQLPLTPNGKVDRKALPSPTSDQVTPLAGQVAPRNETEAKLAAILAQVLGLERVGVTDDFFALGGHSLLAVKFFTEIERQIGRKLPLAMLFRAATIEKLAQAFDITKEPACKWSSLVAIQPQGKKPVLYCVHGAGGNILLYRDLAAKLGKDYPMFGFQSKGLDGHSDPLGTIEAMAAYYLDELKRSQPKGPYYLAGYCLGGMVAYQMARLLHQVDDEVALLALFDTYNPAEAGKTSRASALWQRAKFHASNLRRLPLRELRSYLAEKLRVAKDGELTNLLGVDGPSGNERFPSNGSSANGSVGDPHLQQINDRATELFQPEPYSGSVVLFKPQVNYSFMSDPNMGWGKLVMGNLDVVELPVNPHAMLVEPFVKHLAEALRKRLDQIQTLSRQRPATSPASSEQ